jgi:hypothetical protein
MELKKSLNSMNNLFRATGLSNPKLDIPHEPFNIGAVTLKEDKSRKFTENVNHRNRADVIKIKRRFWERD